VIIAIAGLTVEQGIRGFLRRRRGNAGAGKDEAAKQLVQKHGFVPLAFADPLKRFLADTFDWNEDRLWGPSENRAKEDPRYRRDYGPFAGPSNAHMPQYLTARHALQSLGDGWGRNECCINTWVLYAMRIAKTIESGDYHYDRVKGLLKYGTPGCPILVGEPRKNIVITDLRYQNEAEAVREAGGYLVRVKRFVPKIKVSPTHRSEIDLLEIHDDDFDWVLHNRSTIEDLWGQVDHMAINLGG
jgi:hypothetical protein